MPAASIHMSVCKQINKQLNNDNIEFLIGNIAPDCWRHSILHSDKLKSHFSKDINLNGLEMKIEDYKEFYLKYKHNLNNPFTLGYLTHLMTDYYWKKTVVPKYQIIFNDKLAIKKLNGDIFEGTKEEIKEFLHVNNQIATYNIAKYFELKILNETPNIICEVEEIDLSGLSKTITHINKVNFTEITSISEIYILEDLYNEILNCSNFILKELEKMNF